ncbi:MAG: hypothetical protein ACP5QO_17830 [Clostridia bacterium]
MAWLIYAARLVLLSTERLAFNRLGANRPALPAALLAYLGGALSLLLAAVAAGGPVLDRAAMPGALVYSVSFTLYFWALSVGPLSVVGAWPAATALMLWLWHPEGGLAALLGVVLVVGGGLILGGRLRPRASAGIFIMLASDAALALGREIDRRMALGPPLAYAFTLFSGVTVLMGLLVAATGGLGTAAGLVRERPLWTTISALTNGCAYLTLVGLLRHWAPYLVEALSSAAGLVTVALGVLVLREGDGLRKGLGATLLSLGSAILVLTEVPR